MVEQLTLEAWEKHCASNRNETVEKFREWYESQGLVPVMCNGSCDYDKCRGWKLVTEEIHE